MLLSTADAVERVVRTRAADDAARDVHILLWPRDRGRRASLARAALPCLLLIPDGAAPPMDCTSFEDWVRVPADPREVALRRATLARHVGRDGGRGSGDPTLAAVLADRLIAQIGVPSSRALLRREYVRAGGTDTAAAFDAALARCRTRLRRQGVRVTAIDRHRVVAVCVDPD